MSFDPPASLLALLFWALACVGLPAHPMDDDHVWGTQTLAGQSDYFVSQMALTESRYPMVVYQEGSYGGLRSVAWRNGLKYDEPIPPTANGVLGFKIAAAGTRVFLVYETLSRQLRISSFAGSGWTTPEPVPLQSDFTGFEISVTPAGELIVLQSFDYWRKIALGRRTEQGWTSEIVPRDNPNLLVSSLFLTTSANERIDVGYREYSQNGSDHTQHAMHASLVNGQWTSVKISDGSIEAFFAGPDGFPRVIGRAANQSPSRYYELGTSGWSAPVPISNSNAEVTSASISADGTIYATAGDDLIFRKSGVWATVPEIYSRQVIADELGFPHLLGAQRNVLACHTRTRSRWQTSLVTPIDGPEVRLQGLAMGAANRPRVFTRSGAGPAVYREKNGTWVSAPMDHFIHPAEFAIDARDKFHLFGPFGSYGYGSRQSLAFESLPVTITTGSSSDIQGLVVDKQGRPHVSFIYQGGTGSKAVMYGVKTAGTWSVETVGTYQITPHTAVAVDPAGAPFVFTSEGLYQKTPAGWTKRFAVFNASLPCLAVADDFTVHAIFLSNEKLYALSGKDGNYSAELLAGGVNFLNDRPSLAILHGRPIATFVVSLSYPHRNSLRFAEKTGNYWRQETILPIADGQEYGERVCIATSRQGDVLVAAERTYFLNSLQHTYIQFHRKGEPDPALLDRNIGLWRSPAGKHGFHLRLPDTPLRQPARVEQSGDLTTWESVFDLTAPPDPAAVTDRFHFKGDGFHTDLILEASPEAKASFLRIRETR